MGYKDGMARVAVEHTQQMLSKHGAEIVKCVKDTRVYDEGVALSWLNDKAGMQIKLEQMDVCDAIAKYSLVGSGGKMAVLNFASYMHPGGGFIKGMMAQEEALCHRSFLYNVLSSNRTQEQFYAMHEGAARGCLYSDQMLYSPGVLFDEEVKCDVITCAAPNKGAAMRYNGKTSEEVNEVMKGRIKAVLSVAAYEGVDTLILGAFGCGVFRNDPWIVSTTFKKLLAGEFKDSFGTVIFAIPDGKNAAYFG